MPNSIRVLDSKPLTVNRASDPRQTALHAQSDMPSFLSHVHRDPFVGYVAETDEQYIVEPRGSRPLAIPKGSASQESFPPTSQTEGERAMGMIGWMMFGLLPVGVGALVLCPLVLRNAFNILRRSSVRRERRLALFAAIAALCLGLIGEVFVLLLVLHLIG